jgi:hypothetical protein
MTMTTQQQTLLTTLLSTADSRAKLTDCLEAVLKRRKVVNIVDVSRPVAEKMGEDYAVLVEQCLLEAARRAGILVLDNAPKITGTLVLSDERWALKAEDGEVIILEEGDHLLILDGDDERYWSGVLSDSKWEKQVEMLRLPLRKGYRVDLARKVVRQ